MYISPLRTERRPNRNCAVRHFISFGIHEIPNKILKTCSDVMSPHLSKIFSISLTVKCYPDSLIFAKVAPVYKGGNKDHHDNY